MTATIQDSLDAGGLLPAEYDADSGYVSADLRVSSRLRGITLPGPLLADTSPQARTGGYTAEMFAIDWDNRQATCPPGRDQQHLGAAAEERRQAGDQRPVRRRHGYPARVRNKIPLITAR